MNNKQSLFILDNFMKISVPCSLFPIPRSLINDFSTYKKAF